MIPKAYKRFAEVYFPINIEYFLRNALAWVSATSLCFVDVAD